MIHVLLQLKESLKTTYRLVVDTHTYMPTDTNDGGKN
jgi:hypothetical protein